jgi:peptidase E
MTKYILVGGYWTKGENEGQNFALELVKGFDRPVKILDCIFADSEQADNKFLEDKERFSKFISNFELELATEDRFKTQIETADIVFFRGGDTEALINTLKKCGDWQSKLEGKTVAGTSAGAMALAKYSHALTQNKLIEGFGLVPVKVIAHWQSELYEVEWQKALAGLKAYKEDLPIYTLKEGEYKVFEI